MAFGSVEFPVIATELVPAVPDPGAVVTVDIPEHIVLSVAVVETLVKLKLVVDVGLELDDVAAAEERELDVDETEETEAEVDDETEEIEIELDGDDDDGPAQKPSTQLLEAHCALVVQAASSPPQVAWTIEFTEEHWMPAGHSEVVEQGEPRTVGPIWKGVTLTWGAGWVVLEVFRSNRELERNVLWP